ncbi:DNA polymerase Y family protein [Myxococcus stipitatus]|uniref:Y-family DNA polymerase n=1 Tax=Myxococcus stipitatus TaxID=83455 RepID=UPI001F3AE30E|nr:DNA polymerase Y family protein [Myxococcus stipitatus]MCE9670241.1 DNA polymerase Y family protein [Myxococcus stipitatus]
MRRAYLHFTRFPVQRRVLESPELAGRPFALMEESRGQRRVVVASTTALKAGVRPGMTVTAATALVPELRHFPYRPDEEARALTALGEALLCLGPGFQLSAPDGLWLDAGAAHLSGGEPGLCARALEVCAGLGYRAHGVVASEAFTSRVLARYGARRMEVVADGESARALAPLPLAALEDGVGAGFAALGLTTLGEVAALPAGAVVARGGARGARAHALCRGEDDTPFVPAVLEEVLEERLTLEWPAESFEPLGFALKTLLDRLGARLAGRRRAAVRITFTLRLDPTGLQQVTLSLARPTAAAKLLLDLARHRLESLRLENPVAEVSARVDADSEDRGLQLSLGDSPEGDAALEVVLSRLATTLGEDSLFAAGLEPVHRPEGAHVTRGFHPPASRQALLGESGRARAASVGGGARERPSRLLAEPAWLDAEVAQTGRLVAARVAGRRHRVTAVSGPERLGGEWWSEEPYQRDYYRVHFEGLGPAWVYRDARDGRFYLQGLFD